MFAIAITMVSLFRTMLIAMEELRVTIFLTVQAASCVALRPKCI